MSTANPLDILKSALLLEIRGQAFYKKAAQQAENQAVKEFFESMAAEEVRHVEILTEQYKSVKAKGHFIAPTIEATPTVVADAVLTDTLKQNITAAGFEAAAISAAMGIEERAIKLYAQRATDATDPEEKGLYKWLAEWEGQHLELLGRIDREVTEAVWNDNDFWPF
jgi:rubrerythrin